MGCGTIEEEEEDDDDDDDDGGGSSNNNNEVNVCLYLSTTKLRRIANKEVKRHLP
jgi:hypothetical protein